MAIGDVIGGVGKFIFGDNSKSRDKMNEQNWNDYNDALTNYYGAQAYQSALKNYAEDNPEEWKKASKYFDGAMSDDFLKGSYKTACIRHVATARACHRCGRIAIRDCSFTITNKTACICCVGRGKCYCTC